MQKKNFLTQLQYEAVSKMSLEELEEVCNEIKELYINLQKKIAEKRISAHEHPSK